MKKYGVLKISILCPALALAPPPSAGAFATLLPYRNEKRRKKQHAVKVKPSQLPHDGSTFTAQIMR